MTLSNSIFAVSGAATFLDARKDMSNLFACDTSLEPHPGLLTVGGASAANGNVVVGMSNRMAVTVRPFQAVLNRLGALLIMNDGDVTVPLQAAPSANSRIDVVYVKQREKRAPISDSEDGPIIGVVTGTANLTPVAPRVPDGAVALAQVKVPSGVTNTTASGVVITQVYPFAATRGEELRFRSKGDMDAFAALDGTKAVTLSDNAHYVRNKGAWKIERKTITFGSVAKNAIVGTVANVGNISHAYGMALLGSGSTIPLTYFHPDYPNRAASFSINPSGQIFMLYGSENTLQSGRITVCWEY